MKFQIAEEGFSFHTFELTKLITYEEYRLIKNAFYLLSEQRYRVYNDKYCMVCEKYKRMGIVIRLYENPGKPPHLQLRVNPRLTCGQYDYIGIFPCTKENIKTVKGTVDEVLASIGANYKFNDMTVSRIDLCTNVEMEPIFCEPYMRVIRKCRMPYSFWRTSFTKGESNYKEKNKHSFRASNQDTVFTIYDKVYQLQERKLLEPDSQMQHRLIRFEVSLNRAAVIRVNREYFQCPFNDNSDLLWAFGLLSRKIIQTYVYRFFPEGSYAPYEKVQSAVQKLDVSNKIRKRMLYLLRKASDCSYLSRAVRDMESEFFISGYKTDKVFQCFENLHYNPVTTLGETLPGIRELLGFTLEKPPCYPNL